MQPSSLLGRSASVNFSTTPPSNFETSETSAALQTFTEAQTSEGKQVDKTTEKNLRWEELKEHLRRYNLPENRHLTVKLLVIEETIKAFESIEKPALEQYGALFRLVNSYRNLDDIKLLATGHPNREVFFRLKLISTDESLQTKTIAEIFSEKLELGRRPPTQIKKLIHTYSQCCTLPLNFARQWEVESRQTIENFKNKNNEMFVNSLEKKKRKNVKTVCQTVEAEELYEIFSHFKILESKLTKFNRILTQACVDISTDTNPRQVLQSCSQLLKDFQLFKQNYSHANSRFLDAVQADIRKLNSDKQPPEEIVENEIKILNAYKDKLVTTCESTLAKVGYQWIDALGGALFQLSLKFGDNRATYIYIKSYFLKGIELKRALTPGEIKKLDAIVKQMRILELQETDETTDNEYTMKAQFEQLAGITSNFEHVLLPMLQEMQENLMRQVGIAFEDLDWISLCDDSLETASSAKTEDLSDEKLLIKLIQSIDIEENVEIKPQPIYLDKIAVWKGRKNDVFQALKNEPTLNVFSSFTNLICLGIESKASPDKELAGFDQEVVDHLRLAAIGIENFINAVKAGDMLQVTAVYPMLLMDWHLVLERSMTHTYYKKHQKTHSSHSLTTLSRNLQEWEQLNTEEKELLQEFNRGLIWARYPFESLKISKEDKVKSLLFLEKCFLQDNLNAKERNELIAHVLSMHEKTQKWIARRYGLDNDIETSFEVYTIALKNALNNGVMPLKKKTPNDKNDFLTACCEDLKRVLGRQEVKILEPIELNDLQWHLTRMQGAKLLLQGDKIELRHQAWHYRNILFVQWPLERALRGRLKLQDKTSFSHDFQELENALSHNTNGNESMPAMEFYCGKTLHYSRSPTGYQNDLVTPHKAPFIQALNEMSGQMELSSEEGFQNSRKTITKLNFSNKFVDLFDKSTRVLLDEIKKI